MNAHQTSITLAALGIGVLMGLFVGYKVKRCPVDLSNLVDTMAVKNKALTDSLNERTIVLEAEANMLRQKIDSLSAARPTPKTSVRNALRFVNSASFNTVVDSVLAVPE